MEALNLVGVLAISEWRKAWSVYYPLDIRKVRAALPSPSTLAPKSSEQPLTAQTILPPSKASKGSSQAGDQGQGVEVAKDKGKGKEVKPPSEAKDAAEAKDATKAKDAAEAKDAAVKAKDVEAKSKEADPKAKDTPASQPSKKDDPPPSAIA